MPPLSTPGLLGLSDDLLERVLLCIDQEQLRCTIPLVCKRLERVQRASQTLWRSLLLSLQTAADQQLAVHRLFAWLEQRRRRIQDLALSLGGEQWIDRAAALVVLNLAAPQLISLQLSAEHEGPQSAAQLLASLAAMPRLRHLDVSITHSGQPLAALPQLSGLASLESLLWEVPPDRRAPHGLSALQRLTSLEVWTVGMDSWQPGISHLRGLESLRLVDVEGDVGILTTLTGLRALALNSVSRPLPPGITTALDLSSNVLEAEDSVPPLGGLSAVRELNLSWCRLRRLPAPIAPLESLQMINLCLNSSFFQLDVGGVRALLQRCSHLTCLAVDEHATQAIDANEWLQLGREFPRLRLEF